MWCISLTSPFGIHFKTNLNIHSFQTGFCYFVCCYTETLFEKFKANINR